MAATSIPTPAPTPLGEIASRPCRTELLQELHGIFRGGPTEEAVSAAFETIEEVTGVTLVCLWDSFDWMFYGNSDYTVRTPRGLFRITAGAEELFRFLGGETARAPVSFRLVLGEPQAFNPEAGAWTGDHNFNAAREIRVE